MIKNIIHELRVLKALAAMNLKKILIYKKSFYITFIAMILWITIYTLLIEVIYGHTNEIAGWEKGEMLIILSFYYFITTVSNFLFKDNFENFGQKMRKGELDQFITKPASFQLQCFFYTMRFDQISSLIIVMLLFTYGVREISETLEISNILLGFTLSSLSIFFFYHFLLIVASLTFYLEKAEALGSIMWNLSQVGRYPRQIFTGFAKIFFEFIFPMALITSIPSETFVGFDFGDPLIVFLGIILTFCIVAQLLFKKGITKYTSAN